jgi:hypothetical protein
MKMSNTGLRVLGGVAATVALCLAVVALYACGANGNQDWDGGSNGSSGGSGGGSGSGVGQGTPTTVCDDAGQCNTVIVFPDGSVASADATSEAAPAPPAVGTITAPDCAGCTFPPLTANLCPSNAPAIKIVYPNDTVLIPPNLNRISVQWTPYGPPFSRFEVDFSQSLASPNTDWHIITACSSQTTDMQTGNPGTPSGGCEVTLDPVSWSRLVAANRGSSNPMTITVRGTTDGVCASTSMNAIHMSIAEEDLLGTYYYWKSTVSATGVGGQIWAQIFGDLNTRERDVTSAVTLQNGTLNATCNGCHALSRDGSRMVVYSDDNDSDDEYSDVGGSLLDMTTMPNATELGVGVNGSRQGGQPPGFSTLNPVAAYYVTSNGYPCTGVGGGGGGGRGGVGACGTSGGYPVAVPANGWSEWNGQTGNFFNPVPVGPAGQRPTMPDWSIDGKTVVYVQPGAVAQYDVNGMFGTRDDDMHMFGGSLYTVPYTGNGTFGAPTVFLQSGGENNYYPSYSPDNPMSYVIFNRVPLVGAPADCTTGNAPTCVNDSFSNPAARLMLIGANAAGSAPIDLEKANGSAAGANTPLSNSYPRWAPFVQSYHGRKLLWFTFSSTRDYGVRVLNHKTGLYQCYPADAYQTPGGAHQQPFAAECQEPQLWMAPLTFTEAQGAAADPSGVAFWIPYQDITTHNHTAQWTSQVGTYKPPPGTCTCTATYMTGCAGNACGCCDPTTVCTGNGVCTPVAR